MNIFDMNKNSLPEQVQINKENIKWLLDNASINSFALRAALAVSFSETNTYNVGDLVWHNDGTVEMPENYLYKANQAVSAGIWDESQWDIVKLKDLLDEKQNVLTFDDTPTQNSDNPVKSGGIYDEIEKLKPVLLWENATPNSSFSPAIIDVADMSGFDYVVVLASRDTSNDKFRFEKMPFKINNAAEITLIANARYIYDRSFKIYSNTQIQVYDGYFNDLNNISAASNSGVIIPQAIYGCNII